MLVVMLASSGGSSVNTVAVSSSPVLASWTQQVYVNDANYNGIAAVWTALLPVTGTNTSPA